MAVMSSQGRTKPRGVIVQLLDRLTEARMSREAKRSAGFTGHDVRRR